MKASLKNLPDTLRGGAWPPPARVARRPVKSGNERDPYPYLLISSPEGMYHKGTAFNRKRKAWATVGPYAPNPLGYTRATMVKTKGRNTER